MALAIWNIGKDVERVARPTIPPPGQTASDQSSRSSWWCLLIPLATVLPFQHVRVRSSNSKRGHFLFLVLAVALIGIEGVAALPVRADADIEVHRSVECDSCWDGPRHFGVNVEKHLRRQQLGLD